MAQTLWTPHEDSIISAKYGSVDRHFFALALPTRTWRATQARAGRLGAAGICRPGRNDYRIIGRLAVIYLDRRDGTRMATTVSRADLDRVLAHGKWYASKGTQPNVYYVKCHARRTLLHRFILSCDSPDVEGDHRDGNTLNNTRRNLRKITHSGNAQNMAAIRPNTSSGHKNVRWNGTLGYWVSSIKINGRTIAQYSKTKPDAIIKAAALRVKYHKYFFHRRT